MTLEQFFQEHNKIAIGFSGGVDSAFLLYAGKKYGADIRPYFIKTEFQPAFEWEDAKRLAKELDLELVTIAYDVLQNEQVAENPENRCYYCKQTLFTLLKEHALQDGYQVLIDGTNASDEVVDRPGMKALQELQVRSPLRECGLTKAQIRELSQKAGLFTWNKPAYACLATRIPSQTRIEKEMLCKIERAEGILFALGFSDFRVRVFHGAARIQWRADQMAAAIEKRAEIREKLNSDFAVILYDTEVR